MNDILPFLDDIIKITVFIDKDNCNHAGEIHYPIFNFNMSNCDLKCMIFEDK